MEVNGIVGERKRPRWYQSNRNAAVLAFLTIIALFPAYFIPFVQSNVAERVEVFSLIDGIARLHEDDHTFLAIVILCFSVVFPLAKAILLLIATSALLPLAMKWRRMAAHLAITTGKYSLLDLLVVALLVVVIKVDGIASVEAREGTLLFGAAVILSMLAGLCVFLPEPAPPPKPTPAPNAPAS